jgi:hypothetical protein
MFVVVRIGRLGHRQHAFQQVAFFTGEQGKQQRVRARCRHRGQERRVIDRVVALVGVERCFRLQLLVLDLKRAVQDRLVGLVAIDHDRQLATGQVAEQLERLGECLDARHGDDGAGGRCLAIQVLAVGTVCARAGTGGRRDQHGDQQQIQVFHGRIPNA